MGRRHGERKQHRNRWDDEFKNASDEDLDNAINDPDISKGRREALRAIKKLRKKERHNQAGQKKGD
jgi:hypothetical protein